MTDWVFKKDHRVVRIPTAIALLAPFAVGIAMIIASVLS